MARFFLAGPIASEHEGKLIEDALEELGAALTLCGPLDHSKVDDFLNGLDLFLFPSKNEAESLVVLEATRLGVPVICFNVGCLESLIPNKAYLPQTEDDYSSFVTSMVARFDRDPSSLPAAGIEVRNVFSSVRRASKQEQARLIDAIAGRQES